jgi:hypothetical protein
MARIVAVHGIAQQLEGEDTLAAGWLPALRSGLRRAGVPARQLPGDDDLAMAFYGDLFRRRGTMAVGAPPLDAGDVDQGVEQELLELWWREAARADPRVPGPEDRTMLRSPQTVQRALNALSASAFFAGMAESMLVGSLKQVRSYFEDPQIRHAARSRVSQAVTAETRVVIGHSLGSVVGYEALCAHPDRPVRTFISLGSPLGIRNLLFDRLDPPPRDGIGAKPAAVRTWVNIADRGDVVALVKQLGPRFGDHVQDRAVDNGARAHDVHPYLTAEETGQALAAALGLT